MVSDPEYVARAFINLGDWTKVYAALHPDSSEKKASEGGQRLSQRKDVARALDTIRRRQVYVRKSKDDLLLDLERIIETAEREGDKIQAIKTYAELAGYRKEEKKQPIQVINLTNEELRIAEREISCLPVSTQDVKPG